jgi:hypothetical protein
VLLELAGARSAEDEAHAALLDEAVDLVQEERDAPDLVDDDGRSRPEGPELAGELPGRAR